MVTGHNGSSFKSVDEAPLSHGHRSTRLEAGEFGPQDGVPPDRRRCDGGPPGVPELRHALGAGDGELLRILRNVYGNADAPRELWHDVDAKLKSIGAYRLIGDSSFWIWVEENPTPINEADQYRLIGFVGGHVDDFMRAGDLCNDTQLQVRKSIDELYAWGSKKEENFRYAGLNVEVVNKSKERYVELNQDFYLEDLPPLAIRDERLRQDPKTNLTDGEMAACRASLGALQWAATQTQIQACARVKLLLTELTVNKNMAVEKKSTS